MDDVTIWPVRIFRRFLIEQPGWELVEDMPLRAAAFMRTRDEGELQDWFEQPFVARRSLLGNRRRVVLALDLLRRGHVTALARDARRITPRLTHDRWQALPELRATCSHSTNLGIRAIRVIARLIDVGDTLSVLLAGPEPSAVPGALDHPTHRLASVQRLIASYRRSSGLGRFAFSLDGYSRGRAPATVDPKCRTRKPRFESSEILTSTRAGYASVLYYLAGMPS